MPHTEPEPFQLGLSPGKTCRSAELPDRILDGGLAAKKGNLHSRPVQTPVLGVTCEVPVGGLGLGAKADCFVAPKGGTYLLGARLLYKVNSSASARVRGG